MEPVQKEWRQVEALSSSHTSAGTQWHTHIAALRNSVADTGTDADADAGEYTQAEHTRKHALALKVGTKMLKYAFIPETRPSG